MNLQKRQYLIVTLFFLLNTITLKAFFPFLARFLIRGSVRSVGRRALIRRVGSRYARKKNSLFQKKELRDEAISEVVESILKRYLKPNKMQSALNVTYDYGIKLNSLLKSYGIVAVWSKSANKKIDIFFENKTNKIICGDLTILVIDISSNYIDFVEEFGSLCAEAKRAKKYEIILKNVKIPQGVKKFIAKGPMGIRYISGPILVI